MSRAAHSKSFQPRVKFNAEEQLISVSSMAELTEARQSEIRSMLELTEKHVADYDAEIRKLQLRRQEFQSHADNLSNLFSPIHYLPNELLMHIFEDWCEQNDLTSGSAGSALTLSNVCARWRKLAIAHPGLWSSLKLIMESTYYDEYSIVQDIINAERAAVKLTALVEVYLHRSQNHPLTLDLVPNLCGDDNKSPQALAVLVKQSHRWKSLAYQGYHFSPSWFDCLVSLSLPMLEKISFSGDEGDHYHPGDTPAISAFAVVPRISELTLHAIVVDPDILETFSESWDSLTSLSYDTTWAFDMLWEILDLCPKLRNLELEGCNRTKDRQAESSRRSTPPKTLTSVFSLTVTNKEICDNYDTLECLLASLTLPNLTELTLEQIDGRPNKPFTKPYPIIDEFLGRSKCPLTSLMLHAICLTDGETVTLLSRLPSLQELSITDPLTTETLHRPISKFFIGSLHATKRSNIYRAAQPLVSKLRSLTLRVRTPDFDPSLFIETIESRWLPDQLRTSNEVGVVCLRSVELHLQKVADSEAYEPLIRLDAAGMRVVVKCARREGYIV